MSGIDTKITINLEHGATKIEKIIYYDSESAASTTTMLNTLSDIVGLAIQQAKTLENRHRGTGS